MRPPARSYAFLILGVAIAALAFAPGCGDPGAGMERGALQCSDGLDNDDDGVVDCAAPACAGERVCGCGNGRRDGAEACDDGNADNGDG